MTHPGLEAPVSAATPEVALPPTKPSEILSAAADLIEQPGKWVQGVYGLGKSGREVKLVANAVCFCAIGAISKVGGSHDFDYRNDRTEAAIAALRETLKADGRGSHIPLWNDSPERSASEVVSALRQAAEKAREQGQ